MTSPDPIQAWRDHPAFRETAITATAEFMADPEPQAQPGSVGPEGQTGRCSPLSAVPSGSFSSAAPSTPTRRGGQPPTDKRRPTAVRPVAEEAVA